MEIDFLKRIVKEAGEITKKEFSVKQKGAESDLVTDIDTGVESYLIEQINREYPTFDIVSEEFNSNNEMTDNCFIIDPIDGTINFANNIPLWGIQVACRKNGETIASVIYLVKQNEFYYADSTGAYLNDKQINIRETEIKNAVYSIDGGNTIPCFQRMGGYSYNKRIFGSACVSFAFVASGKIQGTTFRSNKPWDYEPGLFLCKMAGAKTKSIEGFHAAAMNQEFLDILEKETAKNKDSSNIVVLHSLNGDTLRMWGQDIKETFGEKGIDMLMPEFPIRENSKYEKFNEILSFYLNNKQLNDNSIVVAHSISNPYFIRFCMEHKYSPKVYIAVAPGGVYDYPEKRTDYIVEVKRKAHLNKEELDYTKNMKTIKYCLYSDEDDHNIEKFERFIKDTKSTPMYLENYNHFDGYHRIYKIPELTRLIDKIIGDSYESKE